MKDSFALNKKSTPRTPQRSIFRRAACLTAALFFYICSSNSFAQTASDATSIIRSLAPIRGQVITPGYGGDYRQPVVIDRTTIFIDVRHSVSVEVYFRYDSDKITPRAKAELRDLGLALSSPELRPYRYLIAGHTDAVGSNEYNLDLSQRRAMAVRNYLVSAFPIDPDRLVLVGFGFHHLKLPNAPYAAANRRVEVALIVP